jgi:hypothetical protein
MSGPVSEFRPETIDRGIGLLSTRAPEWSILVRLLFGLVVFLPEGIQRLIFPDILGAGRFANPLFRADGTVRGYHRDRIMLLGSLYLLIEGAGAWWLDALLARKYLPFNRGED